MNEADLLAEVKEGTYGGMYLLFGDEDYLKNHWANRLATAAAGDDPSFAAFNLIKLDFSDGGLDLGALSDAMLAPPVMSTTKAVAVNLISVDALREKERSGLLSLLREFSEGGYSDTVLIISVGAGGLDPGTQKKPTPFFAEASKFMKTVQFNYQSDGKLGRWMERHFAEYGLGMEYGIPERIISICGRSMYRLSGEIRKIAAYAASHGSPSVNLSHVEACATRTDEDDAFALANCILEGDTKAALSALGVKIRKREEPIIVLSQVNRVFCDLAAASAFIADGRDKADLSRALKMHEYKAGLYMKAAAMRSPEFFERALDLCLQADISMKTSGKGYAAIEWLICACAEGGKND